MLAYQAHYYPGRPEWYPDPVNAQRNAHNDDMRAVYECIDKHGIAVTKSVSWKNEYGGESRVTVGPFADWKTANVEAYQSAFRMGMPFPKIRKHWWEFWKAEYSAEEEEAIREAWKLFTENPPEKLRESADSAIK
jgi:hypothetical protein